MSLVWLPHSELLLSSPLLSSHFILPLPRNCPSRIQLEHLRLLLNFFAFNSHGSHVPFPFFRFGGALSVVIIALLILLLLLHPPSAQLTVHLPAAISHLHFGAEGERGKKMKENQSIVRVDFQSIDRKRLALST